MAGLQRICKMFGGLNAVDKNGNRVEYVWDYVADIAVLKSEMPEGSERWQASERKKYADLKAQIVSKLVTPKDV